LAALSSEAAASRFRQRFLSVLAVLAVGVGPFAGWEGVLRAIEYRAPSDPYHVGFTPQIGIFERSGDAFVVASAYRSTWHTAAFAAARKSGNLRIFAVGDSVTWGHRGNEFATPLVAYPEQLQDLLRRQRPDRSDEVLNCGARTFGSERVTRVAQEVLQFSPDALLVNVGTSEHLEGDLHASLGRRARRMPSWFGDLRIVQMLQSWLRPHPTGLTLLQSRERDPALRASFVAPESILTSDAQRDRMVQAAKERLQALARDCGVKGVPIALATVPSNLRFAPFATHFADSRAQVRGEALIARTGALLDAGKAAEALALLTPAVAQHPEAAGLHYRRAQALDRLGDRAAARLSYLLARDTDACPARALGAFNDMVRQLARDVPGVVLVDMERLFEAEVPDGIPDDRLFLDNCHPRPAVHARMAQALWQALIRAGVVR